MPGICEGRVAIVTGAGRGIGRAHAIELAREGAAVVVNDIGAELDGTGGSDGPAGEVVESIRAVGGEAIANGEDVSDWEGARRLIESTVERYGRLDVLVNNAGILRDRMLVNMTADEWDEVIRVHLRGTFAPLRWAGAHWRERSRAGSENEARVINTSSGSGLYGAAGQANYGAAKAGIAGLTVIAALELGRYGVTVNAIAPRARTRMTENLQRYQDEVPPAAGAFDERDAENISPLVAWLASSESSQITGRVFNVFGGMVGVAEGWRAGPEADNSARWEPSQLGPIVADLVQRAAPNAIRGGRPPGTAP